MNSFQTNASIVLQYLADNDVNQTTYWLAHACLKKLGDHLTSNRITYSLEESRKWLSGQMLSSSSIQIYAKTIRQIDDVHRLGHVSFFNRSCLHLVEAYNHVVSDYISDVAERYSSSHLVNIRNRCRFFFGFIQMEKQITSTEGISYGDIVAFCKEALPTLCKADSGMYKGTVARLLSWMAEKGLCPIGFSMLLFSNRAGKAFMLGDLSEDATAKIKKVENESRRDFPADEFRIASMDFIRDLEILGYADTMMNVSRQVLDMLFLFLDMNHLGYAPEIASAWFADTGNECFKKNRDMARRILGLFEEFTREGVVLADIQFRYKPLLSDCLPGWCKEVLDSFLKLKTREGKAPSTVCMYRSSITRLCRFMVNEGINSFGQITGELLKKFNLADVHATPEGKNAYNVRIRGFLFFLAENGFVDNYYLGNTLPCTCAPSTEIIKILSPEEEEALNGYSEENPTLALRNRAILMMGLKMGMRGSDITALTFEQIDWRSSCVRFLQEKTDVERTIPLPVETGNALYRYITEGRPESTSRFVFITHKAPYRKIGRGVCRTIMRKAFPEGREDGYGFHVTRRTYATQKFRNDCGYSEVAYLIGHTTNDTVKKYISLDEERMRLCPVSLSEAGISMKGGFRNE